METYSVEQAGEICKRFHLRDGVFWGEYRHKNLHWFLNDKRFGFGDLRDSDIQIIHMALEPGEVFKGYNEHHGSSFMQRENPVIEINSTEVLHHKPIPVTQDTWDKIREGTF